MVKTIGMTKMEEQFERLFALVKQGREDFKTDIVNIITKIDTFLEKESKDFEDSANGSGEPVEKAETDEKPVDTVSGLDIPTDDKFASKSRQAFTEAKDKKISPEDDAKVETAKGEEETKPKDLPAECGRKAAKVRTGVDSTKEDSHESDPEMSKKAKGKKLPETEETRQLRVALKKNRNLNEVSRQQKEDNVDVFDGTKVENVKRPAKRDAKDDTGNSQPIVRQIKGPLASSKDPWSDIANQSAVHKSTSFSPTQMLFGCERHLPCDHLFGCSTDASSSPEIDVHVRQARLEDVLESARGRNSIATVSIKTKYKRAAGRGFQKRDKVLFRNPIRRKGLSSKLKSSCEGPYKVRKRLKETVIRIRKSTNSKDRFRHYDRLPP